MTRQLLVINGSLPGQGRAQWFWGLGAIPGGSQTPRLESAIHPAHNLVSTHFLVPQLNLILLIPGREDSVVCKQFPNDRPPRGMFIRLDFELNGSCDPVQSVEQGESFFCGGCNGGYNLQWQQRKTGLFWNMWKFCLLNIRESVLRALSRFCSHSEEVLKDKQKDSMLIGGASQVTAGGG